MVRSFTSSNEWVAWLNETLPKPKQDPDAPTVIDLFAGCGGLALGFEVAGFKSVGYEMRPVPVATYNQNLSGLCVEQKLDVGDEFEQAEVIIGGPPCQPFSQIGYQRGKHDDRDGFPIFLDAVRRIRPKIAIIENVRGLMFRNKDYLKATTAELERFGYSVDCRLLDASLFGVPQRRERIVVVASRCGWEWPEPVAARPITAGIALGHLATETHSDSKFLTPSMDAYIAEYERKSSCVNPRDLHLDKPARTLTCRNLGGATADMQRIKLPDGRRRMLEVREAARLQSFPDWYQFGGTKYEAMEQIGNSVAPLVGLAIAKSVRQALDGSLKTMPKSGAPKQMELFMAEGHDEKTEQMLNIFRHVGIPLRELTDRRRQRMAKAVLAVGDMKPSDAWTDAKSFHRHKHPPLTTRAIIKFENRYYGENIADASYDDIRRKDLVLPVEFGLVQRSAADPDADVNDGTRGYSLTDAAVDLFATYGTNLWEAELAHFRAARNEIADRLSKAREMKMVPVKLPDGQTLMLTPGPHNQLQKAIVEELLQRFAHGAELLYVGDTAKKLLFVHTEKIRELGLPDPSRSTLPDVVAYDGGRDCIFFVEAVHSFGEITDLRREHLRKLAETSGRQARSCISAFMDRKSFAKFSGRIGWETEVWIATDPAHMIHFDGEKYLTPYD